MRWHAGQLQCCPYGVAVLKRRSAATQRLVSSMIATIFICPVCGADLQAHAQALAVAAARADRAGGVARVCYSVDEPTTCPNCDAPLLP